MAARTFLPREALYELIWIKPMRSAAAELGLSDVGLRKRCRSWGIPVPPKGYWNKVHAGHRVPQRPPLPDEPQPRPAIRRVLPSSKSIAIAAPIPTRKLQTFKKPRKPILRDRDGRVIRSIDDWTTYVVRIERWEWDYGFGLNEHTNLLPGIFSDSRSLFIEGKFVEPVDLANESIRLYLIPDNSYQAWSHESPKGVGKILRNGTDDYLLASVRFPGDALPMILQLFIAGRFRNIMLRGGHFFRHEADVRSFRFDHSCS